MSLCDWLLSLNMGPSRLTHAVAWVRASSLLKAERCSIMQMGPIHHLSVRLSISGHMGCFRPLEIVNNFNIILLGCLDDWLSITTWPNCPQPKGRGGDIKEISWALKQKYTWFQILDWPPAMAGKLNPLGLTSFSANCMHITFLVPQGTLLFFHFLPLAGDGRVGSCWSGPARRRKD